MRFLIGLAMGLFIGASCSLFYANLSRVRDAYPRGVMSGLQQHYDQLRRQLGDPRCPVESSRAALLNLHRLATQIQPAFIDDRNVDEGFRQRQATMLNILQRALDDPPTQCADLNTVLREIGDQCEACHLEYR